MYTFTNIIYKYANFRINILTWKTRLKICTFIEQDPRAQLS